MTPCHALQVDKTRHPKLLHTLRALLPRFDVGYGDKELYWIAATIAEVWFCLLHCRTALLCCWH